MYHISVDNLLYTLASPEQNIPTISNSDNCPICNVDYIYNCYFIESKDWFLISLGSSIGFSLCNYLLFSLYNKFKKRNNNTVIVAQPIMNPV